MSINRKIFFDQQCSEHEGRHTSQSSGRWNPDDPGHAGDRPGRVSVHGQKRGWRGEDLRGHLAILQITM